MKKLLSVSFCGLLGLGALGGCLGSGSDRDSDRYRDHDLHGRDVERASGAARGVPDAARIVDEGRDTSLSYIARDEGTVYLADASARTVVWSGRVRDGDRVRVNPDKNRIEVNGKEQAKIDLKSNDRFQLYFLRR